jgi:hypothetical protein
MYLTHLTKGQRIRVVQRFETFDKDWIEAGLIYTFTGYSFFPYDDGYTFMFEEGAFRLSGNFPENLDVLGNFDTYFVLLD